MRIVRWAMLVVGAALIVATLAVTAYARFGGTDIPDKGLQVRSGTTYYLTASGSVAHCDAAGQRLDLAPIGARELLDGIRVEPAADGRLTCSGGDVTATHGPALALYPVAEYDFVPVLAGAALLVLARFVRPARRRGRNGRSETSGSTSDDG